MSVVLITGAATGIGNLTARALALAGHDVWASMRDPQHRNRGHAEDLLASPTNDEGRLRIVDLDVTSDDSAGAAVATILQQSGQLDVVVHNAGHLVIGYVEAFTADDMQHLFDVNAFGAHRLNRAVLPHKRERTAGTLVYVGSTIPITTPPFLGPYVASKAALDALALTTSFELNPFGIETVIVMPGAFTQGTEHYPNAGHAHDDEVTEGYALLDPLVARNSAATAALFDPDTAAHPSAVAVEITRILELAPGTKPFRSVVDYTNSGVAEVNALIDQAREKFVKRMGYAELLKVKA
jgi:NAD(P)-dependent dehydrogenase (short-subunit alcohol dehydrogenase family)